MDSKLKSKIKLEKITLRKGETSHHNRGNKVRVFDRRVNSMNFDKSGLNNLSSANGSLEKTNNPISSNNNKAINTKSKTNLLSKNPYTAINSIISKSNQCKAPSEIKEYLYNSRIRAKIKQPSDDKSKIRHLTDNGNKEIKKKHSRNYSSYVNCMKSYLEKAIGKNKTKRNRNALHRKSYSISFKTLCYN